MNANSRLALSRAQVREVDRRAIVELGIPGIVLMENAGRGAAEIVRELFPRSSGLSTRGGRAALVCGAGNNGGDGFVIARHLVIAGWRVELFLACDPTRLKDDAAVNYGIVERMKLPRRPFWDATDIDPTALRASEPDVLIDAVLGTGFTGPVRAPLDRVIDAINRAADSTCVVAVDVPSGLDADTGRPCDAAVRAKETITFVARKIGFDAPGAEAYTGRVHVVGIGCPV